MNDAIADYHAIIQAESRTIQHQWQHGNMDGTTSMAAAKMAHGYTSA